MTDSASNVAHSNTPGNRSRLFEGLGAASFLIAAIVLALNAEPMDASHWWMLLLLIGVYALAYRTEYVHPVASTAPTGPVVVAMLFLLPTFLVPLMLVPASYLAIRLAPTQRVSWDSLLHQWASCWGVLGPVFILHAYAPGPPSREYWAVYLLALASQFLIDTVIRAIRSRAGGGRWAPELRLLVWTIGMDTILALLGLSAVIAGGASFATIAFVAIPIALIALLIQDRRDLADDKQELGEAVQSARGEARVDALTGLGNRRAWTEALESAQLRLDADPGLVAAMVLADLNGLKAANDSQGHEVGDALIKAMGEAMSSIAGPQETACRFGGDEYAILSVGRAEDQVLDDLLQRVRAAVQAQPAIAGLSLSAAVGGASMPPESSFEETFRMADLAVYEDKKAAYALRENDRRA